MCGIAGILHYARPDGPDPAVLRRMAARMAHRGPDGEGLHVAGPCGLAHRRLSIIDLAGGAQPLSNEDGTVRVTFNGEIYNYRPLAADLACRGHRFRTRSDTETIVHAYEEHGPACVDALQGMFAFAIWDERARRLLLARDRVGIKPLYYWDDGEQLAFASEIGALLAHPAISAEADPDAAHLFLAFGFVPAPRTGLAGIRKLSPGHRLVCDAGGRPRVERYWRRPIGASAPRGGDMKSASYRLAPGRAGRRAAARELAMRLEATVASHLQSDVPLGVLLSGGIDSTAILGLTARQVAGPVKTFSVYFGEGAYYDETPMARLAAGAFAAEHHEVLVTPERFVEELPHAVRHLEEPVVEAAAVPLLALARRVREHVTVVLSGEGADEDFAGYEVYRYMLGLEAARRLPGAARRLAAAGFARLGLGKLARYARLAALALPARYRGVCLPDLEALAPLLLPGVRERAEGLAEAVVEPIYAYTERAHPLERMLALDTELWLPDDILLKADKMTMAASLELRVPFLDHEVVEFAAGLPPRLKVGPAEGKLLLRGAVRSFVPRPIVDRPKRGFPTPLAALFRSALGDLAERVLVREGGGAGGGGLWREDRVATALAEHRAGRADHHRALWMLLSYELWRRAFTGAAAVQTARAA